MSPSRPLFVGMDVHQDSMAVASVAQEHGAEVTDLGAVGTRQGDIAHLLRKMPSTAQHLLFVYEAGPCGDWRYRYLSRNGDACWVVAPSLIPQKPGDRVKTARRDAVPLASLARSGALTAVDVPTGEADAMRDLTRARADAIRALKDAQLRLKALLRRHDRRDTGRAPGGAAPRRGLSEGVCPTPAQPIVFHEEGRAVSEHRDRLQRLEQARQDHVQAGRLSPMVEARQAWRGGPLTVAVTRMADRGDLTRWERPRALMKCLGLMPSASSSGEHRRQGAMTTAGNPHARRVLVEGAWAYRSPAKSSRHVPLRLEHQPNVIQDIRWKAHVRRCQRYRRLMARGQHARGVTVALARELTGFMWAMATAVPSIASDQDGSCEHAPRSRGQLGKVAQPASEATPPRYGVTLGGVKRLVL